MNELPELDGPPYGSAAGIPPPPSPEASASSSFAASTVTDGQRRRRRRLRLGFVIPVVTLIAAIAFIVGSRNKDDSGLGGLRPGDCIAAPDATGFSKIDTVDCAQPHTQEVYAIGDTSETIATGLDAINDREIIRICRNSVDHRILDMLARTADTSAGFLVERTKTGRVVCTVISAQQRIGSLVASATRTAES